MTTSLPVFLMRGGQLTSPVFLTRLKVDAQNKDETVDQLRTFADLLDEAFRIPIIRYRVGLDALVGLIPLVGDLIGMLFSTYIVVQAARLGLPHTTVIRMVFNVLVETVVGSIPLVGDVFDGIWKANKQNVALLESALAAPSERARADRRFLLGLGIGGAVTASAVSVATVFLVVWLVNVALV